MAPQPQKRPALARKSQIIPKMSRSALAGDLTGALAGEFGFSPNRTPTIQTLPMISLKQLRRGTQVPDTSDTASLCVPILVAPPPTSKLCTSSSHNLLHAGRNSTVCCKYGSPPPLEVSQEAPFQRRFANIFSFVVTLLRMCILNIVAKILRVPAISKSESGV